MEVLLPLGVAVRRSQDAVVVGAPVPSLVPWGRSPDADLVYRTLVTFGPATSGDLGHELGLPARRITAAVDELASISAISRHTGRSRQAVIWVATPPAKVLPALRRHQPAAPPHTVHGAGIRHLPSRALTRARLAELNAVASHEHMAMHPEPAFDAEAMRAAVPLDRMLLDRGVRMRVLGIGPADPDPLIRHGRKSSEPRPEYRGGSSMPMKLIIVDRRVALFPMEPGDLERGYLEVAQPPVVAALVNLFEQQWEAARDPWERAIPQTALSRREYTLISLLARGHTDASAARRMHIGTRSVTTILRGLMDRFGVENRFQLGLVLGALRADQLADQLADKEQQ